LDPNILPKDRLAGLRQNWRGDLTSGFIVFLIALPLCLGIAAASGVPPMAGIISAVIGGLVVSQMSGSFVTINGPAAGLIVVILGAVESLGHGDAFAGYQAMLAAVVVSGVLLFLFGILKAGKLGAFFPASAVHGMLAAIGVIIMSKQIHVAMGVKPDGKDPLSLLVEIPHSLATLNPEIAIIGGVSLAIMIFFSLVKNKYIKMVPAPMVVVLVGIALGFYFDLEHEHKYLLLDSQFTVGPKYLVTLPARVLDGIVFPDFSQVATWAFAGAVLSITLVQGIETLLSATAVDKLDPYHRKSNMNRDLAAVGAGSALSGMIGGLPMIAEIVRSSANINNGAKTRWANFFHGGFMLLFVVAFPFLIHQIPLAALASILIFTGYRLASPKAFASTLKIGKEQLAIFCTTLVVTLATDLIIGVASGIALEIILHLFYGAPLSTLFRPRVQMVEVEENHYIVEIQAAAIFSNYIPIKSKLDSLPRKAEVEVMMTEAVLVDHTTLEHLTHYANDYNRAGGKMTISGLDQMVASSSHPMASRYLSKSIANARRTQAEINELRGQILALQAELQAIKAQLPAPLKEHSIS
jgi:MFS superfamily sulfate permease-like transporter